MCTAEAAFSGTGDEGDKRPSGEATGTLYTWLSMEGMAVKEGCDAKCAFRNTGCEGYDVEEQLATGIGVYDAL